MAIDNRQFFGGLNTDDDDNVLPNGDYRYALNIRNSKQDKNSKGSIENVKGNTVVYYDLGSGNHKCIGAYDDKLNNKIYYFVWSEISIHKILEYNIANNQIVKILQGSALNFQEDKLIIESNVAIIEGLMYWTDGFNPPRKINIEKSKLVSTFTDIDISAIKPAPQYPPLTSFETDTDVKQNSVRGKLFQFRYKWVYDDNEESAWSPISKVALPLNEGQYRPNGYYPTEENNNIKVSIDLGSADVKRVKIAFREGNISDFYLFKDIDKTSSIAPSTTYNFFNDETYSSLDNTGDGGMRLFDWLPKLANSQSLIDGNRIAYGGITEGFDPVKIDITATPQYGELPKLEAPGKGIPINNQYAPTGMYGIPLTNSSTASDFQIYFFEPGTNYGISGYTTYFKWANKTNIGLTNYSSISGFNPPLIYNVSRNSSGRGWYDGDSYAFWITNIHSFSFLLKNDNTTNGTISEGARIVVKINAVWYNFQTLTLNSRTFSFQEVSVNGDSAYTVLNRLKTQIQSTTYIDDNVELSFGCKVGSWSRANGFDLNTQYGAYYGQILDVQLKGVVPSANVVPTTGGIGCLSGTQTASIDTYSGWTTKSTKTLKMGAKHGIGIVYYDFANRSGLVNTLEDKSFYVKYPTERSIGNNLITDKVSLQVDVNHKAPSWATAWQLVYTGNKTIEKLDTEGGYKGFIQCRLSNIQSAIGSNNAIKASISSLTSYNNSTAELVGLVYGYSKGDRIRFLKDTNDNFYQQYDDVEIISYNEVSEEIVFKKPSIQLSGTPTVEIYTPKKSLSQEFYYEVGEVFKCENGVHFGDTNQTVDANGNVLTPATVSIDDIGDTYLRYRTSPINTQIEDYSFSDFYDSDSWDKGRVNIVDNNIKETYRPSTIRYSQPYIPETNINGLSRFDDFDFEAYNQKYGSILLMYSEDKGLNIFQQLKVGQVGVGQSVLYSNDGSQVGTVKNQVKVLSDIRYYAGEYGIGNNPESFAVYGNNKYFVDAKRGAVLRLGGDGITPISEYKMHNYFTDILSDLDSSTAPYKILGVYDVKFGTYIINMNNGTIQETITYSEDDNRWVEYLSLYPDFMVSNRTGVVMFKDGGLYLQNTNNQYNNFFGVQYHSELRFVSNVEPLKVKFYNNLIINSNDVWEMTEAINNNDQKTSLLTTDFEDVEGVYKASLLRDENTPNVSLPLIEGDEIRGEYLDITLKNTSTSFVKLKNVGIGLNLSELTNR